MEISQDEIYDYVFKRLSTSDDIDSLTMRNIIDGLQKTFGLDSIRKEVKSQVRKTVDKVYVQLHEKNQGDVIDTKKNPDTPKYPQTTSKRKRDGSSEESNRNSMENKEKKDNKKQKIEHSDDSDSLNSSLKISLEKSSSKKSNKKASTHLEQAKKVREKKDLNGKHKKEDSSGDSDVSFEFEGGNGENKIQSLVIKEKQNKKMTKAKGSSEKKYADNSTTDSSDDQMPEQKSKSSGKKLKIVEASAKCTKNEVSSDSDNLMSLKSKLKKFEHSVENSNSNFTSDNDENQMKKQNTKKRFKQSDMMKEDDDSDLSSEDDFKSVSVKKKDKITTKSESRSPLESKSHDELVSLKSKLKNFEDSVDTKSENQKRNVSSSSDDDDDYEQSLKKPSTKSSGESAPGKKESRSGRVENESSNDRTNDKKKKRGSKISGKEDLKSSGKEKEDSSKLKNLKRYLRACGMHQNYIKLFEECRSMAGKERKLEEYVREVTGIEGRITLEKCKKYKLKKEKADELAELDVSKIIGTPEKGKRVTRQSSSCSVSKKAFTPSPVGKGVFSNLQDLLDSEESESEKRARKTKKRIVSDSDEDKEDDISSRDCSDDNESEGEEKEAKRKHISENTSCENNHSAKSSDQSDADNEEEFFQDSSEESD